MFHTFLHSISGFSGAASTGTGIALPPIGTGVIGNGVIDTGFIDLDQQFSPRVSRAAKTPPARDTATSPALEDWLDSLPARGWDN